MPKVLVIGRIKVVIRCTSFPLFICYDKTRICNYVTIRDKSEYWLRISNLDQYKCFRLCFIQSGSGKDQTDNLTIRAGETKNIPLVAGCRMIRIACGGGFATAWRQIYVEYKTADRTIQAAMNTRKGRMTPGGLCNPANDHLPLFVPSSAFKN